jgi:ribose 5-phosphate isomerase B
MRVVLGSDHNGNAARNYVRKFLQGMPAVECLEDYGFEDGKVDYPDMAKRVCDEVLFDFTAVVAQADFRPSYGILICGTGTGMCIAANKTKGIRAGLATDRATAELMREHNDCNVLCLGQWRNSLSQMEEMVRAFLTTPFGGGRHDARVEMLRKMDARIT